MKIKQRDRAAIERELKEERAEEDRAKALADRLDAEDDADAIEELKRENAQFRKDLISGIDPRSQKELTKDEYLRMTELIFPMTADEVDTYRRVLADFDDNPWSNWHDWYEDMSFSDPFAKYPPQSN